MQYQYEKNTKAKGELSKTAKNQNEMNEGMVHALLEHPWTGPYCHLGCKYITQDAK